MSEIPAVIVAVSVPVIIRVEIMAEVITPVRTGKTAEKDVSHKEKNGISPLYITGRGQMHCINQPEFQRRKNRKKEKDTLKSGFGDFIIFGEFFVCTDNFIGFLSIFPDREKAAAGVNVSETSHNWFMKS